jgi:hypothetical protein
MTALEGLHRLSLKIFARGPRDGIDPPELVPIFHRWIQTQAVDGLLIDVADYAHLPEGPGAVLIAHEGNYAFDGGRGRPGLQYSRKQPIEGPHSARLGAICRILLKAARLLEVHVAPVPADDLRANAHGGLGRARQRRAVL